MKGKRRDGRRRKREKKESPQEWLPPRGPVPQTQYC